MQVQEKQLIRQQEILKGLGFYNGPIDGIWGPDTIKAMQKFEASPSYLPGVPNNGLPMKDRQKYPAGIVMGLDGLLHHPVIDLPQAPVPVLPVEPTVVQTPTNNQSKKGGQ